MPVQTERATVAILPIGGANPSRGDQITATDCSEIKIKYDPDLTICKTADRQVAWTTRIRRSHYTITVRNTGDVSFDDVVVTDREGREPQLAP